MAVVAKVDTDKAASVDLAAKAAMVDPTTAINKVDSATKMKTVNNRVDSATKMKTANNRVVSATKMTKANNREDSAAEVKTANNKADSADKKTPMTIRGENEKIL
ncbi:uncharacterized protein LOC123875517 [Maniola jurtina]|uniref:uncharacterized protein LOC123875517 n=1 Tax=Maniola jurtina TaxID=191418 RepID=UPI001E68F311|nr:uncharacterized protein LOC123875517 [Maniola jurtina]